MSAPALRTLAVAALLLGSAARADAPPAAAAQPPGPPPIVVDLGGQPIVLPPPPGWVRVETASADSLAPFTRFVSAEERVLAGFAPRSILGEVPSGAALMKLALAASTTAFEAEDISPERFAEITAYFRGTLPDADVVLQDPDALGLRVLVQAQTEAGDKVPDYDSATLLVFTRVKSRFIRLGLVDFTATAASAESLRATATGWLVALRAANGGRVQPAM